MNEQKLPKGALRFVEAGCHAHVEMADIDGKGAPKLKMVAYSGGVIKDHWYWDNLAIDLDGMKFSGGKFPVLENHSTDRKIAVIGKPLIEDGKLMAPENAKFMPTEAAEEFIKLSQEGFPYQSSIYAKPSNVERIAEGSSAQVNGFTLKGPASIWRQCEFREMSVCVFGWDSKTQASAFSKDEFELLSYEETEAEVDGNDAGDKRPKLNRRKEVKTTMNEKELRETHPELVKTIVDAAVATAVSAAETKFSTEKDELSTQVTTLQDSNTKLSDKVLDLEKKDVIRSESELKVQGKAVWTQKLGESAIPEHVWEKVSQHVSHAKFVTDGVLDTVKFGEAIDAEIKDWEGKGVTSSVLGAGFSTKEPEDENKQTQEAASVDADVARLANLAGVKTSKE